MAGRELAAIFRMKTEGTQEVERLKDQIGDLDSRFGAISGKAVAAGAAIGVAVTAVVALGAAAFRLGQEFDDAADSILIKSGAVGDTLGQLQADFENVVKNVPTDFKTAADAIGLLHARTGQTGEGLQELATQLLNLSRLTGTDASENIRQATRAFGDWGIATEEQSLALDKMFRAAQLSGSSVAQLTQTIVQFGAPMRQLGISFDESLAMMAKWEKEGVNVETVLGTMRIALAKFAEAGLDPQDVFGRLVNTIRDMESPIEATALAMEVFGKRGGADMAAAIREGRFAIDEYVKDIEGAGGAIEDAARKTDDAKQEMEKAWNELKVAARPVVETVFEAMNAALTAAAPLMKDFAANLRNIAEAFKAMKEGRVTWSEVAAAAMGIETRPGSGPRTEMPTYNPSPREGFPTVGGNEPGAPESPPAPPGGPGLSAAELAALRKDEEAIKAAARAARDAQRELEREAKAAAREAERIIKEAQRQSERQAEIEAQRANTIRDLGEKRAHAIEEAENAYIEAWQKALDKEEEQISKAEEQFARERANAEERKRLQEEFEREFQKGRDIQGGRRLGTQQEREFADIDLRRKRETEDLQDRQAKKRKTDAEAERKDMETLNAARFRGDSLAVLAAMKAAENRKKAIKDQDTEEMAALEKRRQREDEDHVRKMSRQADDLIQARKDAAEIEQLRKDLSKPLEAFNQKLLEDHLAEKIQGYIKAKEDALVAAENMVGKRTTAALEAEAAGVSRAQNIGVPQTVILNNYNYGVQGPDAVDDMLEELLETTADHVRTGD